MYICICNALNEQTVIAALKEAKFQKGALHRILGVKPSCGKCVPQIKAMARELNIPDQVLDGYEPTMDA